MISIKPKWVAKILNGEKTIEVRRNKTLANAIQKLINENGYADIYVYCSKDEWLLYKNKTENKWDILKLIRGHKLLGSFNGKVVFKFRCYKVEEIKPKVKLGLLHTYNTYETETLPINPLLEKCCLSYEELDLYLKWKVGYAIHISDLEIFDKPKELSEFYKVGYNEALVNSLKGKPFPISPHFIQNQYLLRKAPQNFCYVEVEE